MSLILDALNKADRERSESAEAPSIHSAHKTPVLIKKGLILNKKTVAIGMATLLVLFISAYYIGKMSSTSDETSTNTQVAPTKSLSSNSNKASNIDTQKNSYATFQKRLQEKKIAEQYKKKEQAPVQPALTNTTDTNTTQTSENTLANPKIKPKVKTEDAKTVANINDLYSDKPKTLPAEKKPAANNTQGGTSLSDFKSLGTIRDLPWNLQDQIPSLNYMGHNYANGNGTITINKNTYRTGSKITEDLVVYKILEDGVIMRFKQEKFKMQALSSWVNM